ncbi:MAG: cytochrome c-type biogenesis protein CcmH [Halocynthiibacter sp.]
MRPIAILLALMLASPVWAVLPGEMLDDKVLEARAQVIDEGIRCVQCQSENIGSSNAVWAADARRTVRELLVAGATNEEVMTFFVERYGERVLMLPRKDGSNLLLWGAGPLMLLLSLSIAVVYIRGRKLARGKAEPLSNADKDRLSEILKG